MDAVEFAGEFGADALGVAESCVADLIAQGVPAGSAWAMMAGAARRARATVEDAEKIIAGYTSTQPQVKARRMRSAQVVGLVDAATSALVAKAPSITAMARASADPASALGQASGELAGKIPPMAKRRYYESACRLEIKRLINTGKPITLEILAFRLGTSQSTVHRLKAYQAYREKNPRGKIKTTSINDIHLATIDVDANSELGRLIADQRTADKHNL